MAITCTEGLNAFPEYWEQDMMSSIITSIEHCAGGFNQGNGCWEMKEKSSRFEKKNENCLYLQMKQSYIEKILRNPCKNCQN